MFNRLAFAMTFGTAFALSACSSSSQGPPPPFTTTPTPTASASASPTATATATGVGTPTASPTGGGTPTATPIGGGTPTPTPIGATPTPTPVGSSSPHITGSLTSMVVCTQSQMACADDLNPYAGSGEQAVVLVLGSRKPVVFSNAGGSKLATLTSQVYATKGAAVEYEVFYKSATVTPTTDTLSISDPGTMSSLTIPVTIVSPGDDAGPSFFALYTSAGFVCPGQQVTFETKTAGDKPVTLSTSNANLLAIGGSNGNFAIDVIEAGSGVVTATAGTSTVIYPANIPATGFTSAC